MKNKGKILLMLIVISALFAGCASMGSSPKTPEAVAEQYWIYYKAAEFDKAAKLATGEGVTELKMLNNIGIEKLGEDVQKMLDAIEIEIISTEIIEEDKAIVTVVYNGDEMYMEVLLIDGEWKVLSEKSF